MSNVIWSATKGWHDGPEVKVQIVKAVRPSRDRARTFARIHAAAIKAEVKR